MKQVEGVIKMIVLGDSGVGKSIDFSVKNVDLLNIFKRCVNVEIL
jgi:hypothetical protein